MTDETAETQEETVSLEDLAAQFNTESQPPQRDEPRSEEPPKFESSDDALKWLAKQHSDTRAQLNSLSEKLTQKEQQEFVNEQMSALESAIKTIGAEVELDPMLIEGALHTTYNRDKNFQKIFDNRASNPAAYKQALGVISQRLKALTSTQKDPQLEENRRAMEQLQRSSRTGSSEPEDPTADMSAADFDRYWEKLKSGG